MIRLVREISIEQRMRSQLRQQPSQLQLLQGKRSKLTLNHRKGVRATAKAYLCLIQQRKEISAGARI
jgi:hypothetical protein